MLVETEFDMLSRLLQIQGDHLSAEGARFVLSLRFTDTDHERMQAFGRKANEGTLSPEERQEYQRYVRVADLLAIMKSKARLFLKNTGQAP